MVEKSDKIIRMLNIINLEYHKALSVYLNNQIPMNEAFDKTIRILKRLNKRLNYFLELV